jgi:hypothetical protein
MPALAEFQHDFTHALFNTDATQRNPYGVSLAVYQNTVMKGLVDVLRANYPTVEQLVGIEWFDSIALMYAREHLPTQPALALYGEQFPEFIDAPAATHGLHYLSSVARLDRLWTETHFAADAPVLTAASLQAIAPERLAPLALQLHPATRIAWLPHSAVSIWQHNRPPATPTDSMQVDDVEQGMLLTRPLGVIEVQMLNHAGYVFLQQLQAGMSLSTAAMAVLEQQPDADIASLLARMIQAGVFMAFDNKEGHS